MNRIELIRNQLFSNLTKSSTDRGVEELLNYKSIYNPLDKFKQHSTFDKEILEKIYFPFESHKEFRNAIFQVMKDIPEFRVQPYQTEMKSSEIKELVAKQMKLIVKGIEKVIPFKQLREDPIKFGVFLECITHYDAGLAVRFAFHSILYYNALKFLGDNEIHREFLERSITLEDIGSFGLTEQGHGSNVRCIKTTATYDPATKEFVLHSSGYDAYKWWIGGAGRTANMSVIFAQLYTKNQCHGVHAFLVPLRSKADHMAFPGVIIGDTGPKIGNEGVDNGFIGFFHYRIPRESLLNKISQVSEDGTFTSSISNADVRFATALGELSEGRVGVCINTQVLLTNGLTIAGRYACLRTQFSTDMKGDNSEQPIINYPTTQVRLIPALAESLAMRAACFSLGNRWISILPYVTELKNPKVIETHAVISALKPYCSHLTQTRFQQLREVMGGHGYSRFNLIGGYRNNNDINTTWEGDNTVLVQQTAKFIMDNFGKKMKGKEVNKEYTTLNFLDGFMNVSDEKLVIESADEFDNIDKLRLIFKHRVNVNLQMAVQKLAERVEMKKDGLLVAWNNSQVFYLQSLVKSYTENFVFDAFRENIEALKDNNCLTKKMLLEFLKLYSLTIFEADLGTLRYGDFINSEAGYIIKDEILELCSSLKKELIPILDVISAPDELLNTPMGRSDGRIWESYLSRVFSFNKAFEKEDWWQNLHK